MPDSFESGLREVADALGLFAHASTDTSAALRQIADALKRPAGASSFAGPGHGGGEWIAAAIAGEGHGNASRGPSGASPGAAPASPAAPAAHPPVDDRGRRTAFSLAETFGGPRPGEEHSVSEARHQQTIRRLNLMTTPQPGGGGGPAPGAGAPPPANPPGGAGGGGGGGGIPPEEAALGGAAAGAGGFGKFAKLFTIFEGFRAMEALRIPGKAHVAGNMESWKISQQEGEDWRHSFWRTSGLTNVGRDIVDTATDIFSGNNPFKSPRWQGTLGAGGDTSWKDSGGNDHRFSKQVGKDF